MARYGDIMKVDTTGASYKTAGEKGEKLSYYGVRASNKMAGDDLERMNSYKPMILRVGRNKRVDPAVIAGIISRESRAGEAIKRNGGRGDWDESRKAYNGYGLMQVDVNPKGGGHTARGSWGSEEHLEQATDILIYFIKRIQEKFPKWDKEQHLKGGLAAYNQGDGKVWKYRIVRPPFWQQLLPLPVVAPNCFGGMNLSWEAMDASDTGEFDSFHSYQCLDNNTTGMDYANDVVARAQFYKTLGYKL